MKLFIGKVRGSNVSSFRGGKAMLKNRALTLGFRFDGLEGPDAGMQKENLLKKPAWQEIHRR